MSTAHFTGRIFPAGLNLSLANQPTFQWRLDELGLNVTFRVHVHDGSIRIDCDLAEFEAAYLGPLFMRAYDIARATVDLAAFATGNGLAVILEEFVDPSGSATQLAAQYPSLAALSTAVKPGSPDFDKVLQAILAEPRLSVALRDLIEVLTFPQRSTLNCARAIRSVGPLFKQPGGSPDRAWSTLRENLQVSKTYTQRITQYYQGNGDSRGASEMSATDVVPGAWIIMNRLLEFLKRGGQPLPLSEFPLLI